MSEEINVIHSYSTLDTKVGKLCNGIYRHCWEIDDFVNKLDMKNGESLKSCTFTTKTKNSQTDWCIVLYPNGARPELRFLKVAFQYNVDFISLKSPLYKKWGF